MSGIALRPSLFLRIASLAVASILAAACGGGDDDVVVEAPRTGRFVYAVNIDDNNMSGYTIDATTGSLSVMAGSPFETGVLPFDVAISPSGKFVYVANSGDEPYTPAAGSNVSAYAVNPTSGVLTPLAASPFVAGSGVAGLAFNIAGTRLYAMNATSNDVSAYAVNVATGALSPIAGSPFAVGELPQAIVVDPSGKFVLVANGDSDTLSVFAINPVTGGLTPVAGSPFQAGDFPYRIAFGAGGKFVFVINNSTQFDPTAGTLSAFSLNPSTGALVELAGSPFAISSNGYLTADRSGAFLYVPVVGGLSAYSINAISGALTLVPGSPFATGADPTFVSLEPAGKFLYLGDCFGGTLTGYAISATSGALTRLPGSPAAAGTCPLYIATF